MLAHMRDFVGREALAHAVHEELLWFPDASGRKAFRDGFGVDAEHEVHGVGVERIIDVNLLNEIRVKSIAL